MINVNYVWLDDELPDYIIVMVANKKPKARMTEDLSLFLGDNTAKFTDWYLIFEKYFESKLGCMLYMMYLLC